MANQLERKVVKGLRNVLLFLCSKRSIPMLKGTLAYILAFVLIFLRKFDDLSAYPLAFSGMMIVVIVNGAGKSVGACIQSVVLAMSGVSIGCVGFVILAKLSHKTVAQAFVFALIVYAMALVKAQGLRWLPFALLCILNSFNGIYSSYLLGGVFNSKYLIAYYTAYLWGAGISLGVNVLVFPHSSERELRHTLVTSLEHLGTFAHLLAKGYTFEISKDEMTIREHLSQTIRADFGYLLQKIQETTIEINYSPFSMKAYQSLVARIRALQQALITAHSSLVGVEEQDYDLFKEHFLPSTISAFNQMRRAVDLTIRDIGNELGCKPMVIPATQETYRDYMSSMESQTPREELTSQLAQVSEKLAAEVERHGDPPKVQTGPADISVPTTARAGTRPSTGATAAGSTAKTSSFTGAASTSATSRGESSTTEFEYGIQTLRREFDRFAMAQNDILQEVLVSGHVHGANDGSLRLHQPRGSLKSAYSNALGAGYFDEAEQEIRHRGSEQIELLSEEKGASEQQDSLNGRNRLVSSGHSLVRVWGFLFALEQFVSELESLSSIVKPEGIRRKKMLHVHLFEALLLPHQQLRPEEDELPLQDALALLDNRQRISVKRNVWQRMGEYADIIQSPASIFALKTAGAATAYAVLIYASSPRPWFINYSMVSGMLTIVVALAPTLGQSMLTFVLQIAGSSIGLIDRYLWSLAVLEMFRNVGGYKFNPFGIIFLILPFALIMEYLLYHQPQFFIVALLALNGCGVVVVTEWVAVEYLHRQNFDSPAFRTAKALTALTVALAVVAIFQLFILRNPARHTLRKQVASLTFEMLSYVVMLQAFGRSVLSLDPEYRPSVPALLRVDRELRHRELKLQSKIIDAMPLLSFAAAEPQLARPFRKDLFLCFINSNQIILDRLREARAAIGTNPFEEFILSNFVSVLGPYRALNTRLIKGQLYVVASSLQSKIPLPQDTPMRTLEAPREDFIHDALVLSARFAQTEEGNKSIRSREFMRYISYLLGWISLHEPLRAMEDASKELFGELERKLM